MDGNSGSTLVGDEPSVPIIYYALPSGFHPYPSLGQITIYSARRGLLTLPPPTIYLVEFLRACHTVYTISCEI